MSGDNTCTTTVTLCQTVPSKVIVNIVNQDSPRNKVTSGKTVTVVSLKPPIPPAVFPMVPRNPTIPSSVLILSQDNLSQSYISTQLLQASRSQHSGVTHSVVSPPVTATLVSRSSNPTVTTPARVLTNQLLNFNVKYLTH